MSEELYFCHNCGELSMRKDSNGYYFCPECNFTSTEDIYDDMESGNADYEMYDGVYSEVYVDDKQVFCPRCGHAIVDKGDGTYICNWSMCNESYSWDELEEHIRNYECFI